MIIYHNPQCSKSRRALELLKEKAQDFKVVEYLKTPLAKPFLEDLIEKLDVTAESIIRKKESLFKELDLDESKMKEPDWIQLIVEHPRLMERPIFEFGQKAIVARPPEKILEVLE